MRRSLATAAGLLLLGLLLAAGLTACGGSGTPTVQAQPTSSPFDGGGLVTPKQAADFALRDQHGRLVSLAAQRGKLVLLTFLYTHCPDVCPLIAENLNQTLRTLGPAANDVRVLAVSVDPKGDTKASVSHFVRVHHLLPQFHYLTGSAAALGRVWKAYGVFVDPQHLDAVDHTAYTVLIDRNGKERVLYPSNMQSGAVTHDVRYLLGT